jgi:hypothetical protein
LVLDSEGAQGRQRKALGAVFLILLQYWKAGKKAANKKAAEKSLNSA